MALNYSHRQVFTPHIAEDNLVSPVRIMNGYFVEGSSEKNGEGYSNTWHVGAGEADERNFECDIDIVDLCSSSELSSSSDNSESEDIRNLLPTDPFNMGMDLKTTFTAITGWLEDLEVEGYMMSDSSWPDAEGYGLFARWNLFWNSSLNSEPFTESMGARSFPSYLHVSEKLTVGSNYLPQSLHFDEKLNEPSTTAGLGDIAGLSNVSVACSSVELQSREEVEGAAEFDGVPHEGLAFALSYLGVKDLLSVERVCRSLLYTVRGDPLFWMTIHIDQPLNEKMTDDILMQLVSRAQGSLQCLSLVECPKVTEDSLRHILATNPRLTKLCVPGCTRISIECVVNNIKAYNNCNKDVGGIKLVRIGGIYGVSHEHMEELKLLLGANDSIGSDRKPHLYQRGSCYISYDDDRAIDIEMCPKCEKFRLVYDCPAEGCRVKDKSPHACRGCTLCIARCAQCGRCVNDTEFEETFSLELLCSDCFKQLVKYSDKKDEKFESCSALVEPSCHVSSLHG
ncbi:hypothetical protein ABFS83_11G064900 [Erythranthe nasuta]